MKPEPKQAADYVRAGRRGVEGYQHKPCVVAERFVDKPADTCNLSSSPVGSRITRAGGLALRKRFCRKTSIFELKAGRPPKTALLPLVDRAHSFPLEWYSRF